VSQRGFGTRSREGTTRTPARNVAERQGLALEGPGAEARLDRIQRRFRRVERSAKSQASRRASLRLLRLAAVVFLCVVGVGLVVSYVFPFFGR
jgi:Flp pilus assembly protein TadB